MPQSRDASHWSNASPSPKKSRSPKNGLWGSTVDIGHLFEEAAAVAVQSAWRGQRVRRDLLHQSAAVMLQSAWRGKQVRRQQVDLRRYGVDGCSPLPEKP